jgi:hypothetical protein
MHDTERIEQELQETIEAMSAEAHDAWEKIEWLREQAMVSDNDPPYLDAVQIIDRTSPSAIGELGKASELRARLLGAQVEEAEGVIRLYMQISGAMERAIELEPDLDGKRLTVGEALEVLERHGVKHGISTEVLEMKIEADVHPVERERIRMPADEVPTDENGIPLRSAFPDGFGFRDAKGEVICFDALEADAMRLLGQHRTFESFIEELPEDAVRENQSLRQEFIELLTGSGQSADKAEERADEAINRMLCNAYLEFLALVVKEEPEVQGMVDYFRGAKTAAAERYIQRTVRSFVDPLVEKFVEAQIADGELARTFNNDGNEFLKINTKHPAYKRRQRELREKVEALSPERRKIYDALQDEKRGEHRMNGHGAMHTVENLTDEEVSELRPRIRRIRRGLEVQKVPYRRAPR